MAKVALQAAIRTVAAYPDCLVARKMVQGSKKKGKKYNILVEG